MLTAKVYRKSAHSVVSHYSFVCALFMMLLFSSCNDDGSLKIFGHINHDFQVYVDRFVKEAEARGVIVDTTGLSIIYSDTIKTNCGYGFFNTKTVLISSGGCFRSQTDDLVREILIFHELGHAILGRPHDTSLLLNGDKRSIMFPYNPSLVYNSHCEEKRKYYIDQLFDEYTSPPEWAKEKTTPTVIFADSISNPSAFWKFYLSNGSTNVGKINSFVSSSPASSLQIIAATPSTYSAWYIQNLTREGLKQSNRIELRVRAKLENVKGDGVVFSILGYSSDGMLIAVGSNQFATYFNGTSEFAEFSIDMPYYIESITSLQVLLEMSSKSTGIVYFDDVKITKYE